MNRGKNNMQLKYIKLRFSSLRIVRDTFKDSLDLEEVIAQPIHVRWLKCGQKNS